MAASRPRARTLTEALRRLDRKAMITLLEARPDLCYPLPQDHSDLANRAATSTSIVRAVDALNAWQRTVTEALAALPDPGSVSALAELLERPRRPITAVLKTLRQRALLWGEDDQLHLVRGVREQFEPYPNGLAAPSLQPLSTDAIKQALEACDDSVRPVLDRLLWGPPTGAVQNAERIITPERASTPIDQLLSRRLLRASDPDTVILPREVALYLRRDAKPSRDPVPEQPPTLTGRARNAELVDKAAAGAGYGLLHDLELAIHGLEATPHRLLRTGGLSARDVNTLGRNLGTDTAHANFVLECAAAAGLVAPASNLTLLPTTDYDRWANRDAIDQWRQVVTAWTEAPRFFARSTEPGAHTLGDEADSVAAASLRKLIMREAAAAPAGTVLSLEELAAVVSWHRPRWQGAGAAGLSSVVASTWREAEWLGLAALGAPTSYVALLADPAAVLPRQLVEYFPTPVERIIIQADLTAVAPGPLTRPITHDLRLLADQESRGGGGVYRFSAASMRRAFDAGWSSADIHSWLEKHSTTGIPQPLTYVIDDVARQYGNIRVGPAGSFIRTEDEAQTAALLADPESVTLGLRLVAPGVLVAAADPYEVVALLRRMGSTPAVEDELGRPLSAPPTLRAPVKQAVSRPPAISAPDAADAILAHAKSAATRTSTEQTLKNLELAAQTEAPVRIAYVADDGTRAERELSPLGIGSGQVRAIDILTAQILTIPLARISAVGTPRIRG